MKIKTFAGFLPLLTMIALARAQAPAPAAPAPAVPAPIAEPATLASCAEREAQIVGDGTSAPNTFLLSVFADKCLGVKVDVDPFTVSVRSAFGDPPSRGNVKAALQVVINQLSNNPGFYAPDQARQEAVSSVTHAISDIDSLVISGAGATSSPAWKVNGMETPTAVPSLHVASSLSNACIGAPSSVGCKHALDVSKNWLRLAHLVEGALTLYTSHALEYRQAESQRRLDMWHAYRDEALPQYPWEWLLNGWYIGQQDRRGRDAAGPLPPPTSELVFLHPGVGVEWRDGIKNGSKAQPSIYLEVAGFYRWSWAESSGAMEGAKGISVIASYTQRDKETKVGYGLLFHWRKSSQLKPFSIAVTKSGGNTSILLNVDLAEYFKDKLGYFKAAEGRIDELKIKIASPSIGTP